MFGTRHLCQCKTKKLANTKQSLKQQSENTVHLINNYILQIMTQNLIDLTIFKNLNSNKCNNYISNCNQLQRLSLGLKYYRLVCNNTIDKDVFVQFCQETYTNFLDDYCHFIKHHHYDLEQIKDELLSKYKMIDCDLKSCKVILRHYRTETIKTDYSYSSFYIDCYDRIHHQIYHLNKM